MYFKGDIIITDPCYVTKKKPDIPYPSEYEAKRPKDEDFFTITPSFPNYYPDAVDKDPSEYTTTDIECIKASKIVKQKYEEKNKQIQQTKMRDKNGIYRPMKSELFEKEFARLLEADYQWKLPYMSDWELSGYGSDLEQLGFKTFMQSTTYYGDWGCTTVNTDTQEKIGQFCADTGQVCVFLLDEVLAYNPNFNYHIEKPWTTTLIKDFDGNVEFEVVKSEEDTELHIVGKGNINFKTFQTSM